MHAKRIALPLNAAMQFRAPRQLAETVADVAERQADTMSAFTRQALLDKLSQLGIELRSVRPASEARQEGMV